MTILRTPKEYETHRRIMLSIYAYAYEFEDHSIVSDAEFDELSYKVDLTIETDRPDLDKWFKENFVACSGMWIHNHPELDRIKEIYNDRFKVHK